MMETTYSEAQEQYWELSYRCGVALVALWDAEREVARRPDLENRVALLEAKEARRAAVAAERDFFAEHPGETFRVFRPEDIDAAISPDIKPLWPQLDNLT